MANDHKATPDHSDMTRITAARSARSGTLRGIQHTTAATGGSMYDFRDVRTGAGRVRIELRPVNRGPLLTLPAPSCSDVFVVK